MAFTPTRLRFLQNAVQKVYHCTCLTRALAYKSAISLETLYPNSSLKLTTPSFTANSDEKFTGFIPINKLDITYSASSGPGGQNVNKVHTKVDVRFKLRDADWLHSDVRNKMMELHGNRLTKEGYLILKSDLTRSQQMNLADCLRKLRNMIRDAAVTDREPSPETREKIRQRHLKAARLRVAIKREESVKRAMRQPPTIDL